MFVCLPLISLILLWLVFWSPEQDWRSAVLSAAVTWGVLVAVFTEFLSLFRLLTFSSVLTLWLLTTVALGFIYYKLVSQGKPLFPKVPQIRPLLLVELSGVVFIAATVGLIALVAPPNTWDSMTYHMSRVVHWIQNQSVAFYPTYNLPQLFHPPWAEYAIMHLQILSGGDRFANLVQWFSMLGSIIGVSLIAKELQANGRGQVFAAVFCATIPMGILQASSTQNDYAVGFWLVCLAYFVLRAAIAPRKPALLFIGASLGLAILTKSSAYLYAFPFMVWFSLNQIKRWRWRAWKPIAIATAIFLVLNLNHYLRNFDLFGSFIGAPKNFSEAYKIEIISLPTLISNVLRNLALHLDIVRNLGLQPFITPITGIAHKMLLIVHSLLGVELNDPRITAGSYSGVPGLSFDENVAGNPLHFFIILGAIAFCFFQRKLRRNSYLIAYLLAIVAGFLLLCLLLKIQAYQSRHHLSAFLLLSAFVGVIFSQLNYKLANLIALLLIFTSLPWVFNNKFRPIAAEANIFNTSRIEQYFINRPYLEEPYRKGTNFVLSQECSDIGLSLGRGTTVGNEYWEYPFWVLLQNQSQAVRLENIDPQNVSNQKSKVYPHNRFTPCAIIAVRRGKDPKVDKIVTDRGTYRQRWSAAPVSVLVRQ